MLRSFPLFVGLRYSLAQKNSLLLSFVSLISVLGVTLGVLILIVALAVINGSIETLRKRRSNPPSCDHRRAGAASQLARVT